MALNTAMGGFVVHIIIPFLLFSVFVRHLISVRHSIHCFLVGLHRVFRSRALSGTRRYHFVVFRFTIFRLSFRHLFDRDILTYRRFFRYLPCLNTYFENHRSIRPILF